MKKILLIVLVPVFLVLSVAAHAASPIFLTKHVLVEVEDKMVYAEAVINTSAESFTVTEMSLYKKTGDDWEKINEIAVPEISGIGYTFSTSASFDTENLDADETYKVVVTFDADGYHEDAHSMPFPAFTPSSMNIYRHYLDKGNMPSAD